MAKLPMGLCWHRFNSERSTTIDLLENNFVSITVPSGWTYRDAVQQIAKAARKPIPIESLSDDLNVTRFVRAATFFGDDLGLIFSEIVANYPHMGWWISDNGLNMASVLPDELLSSFDALAGRLYLANWENRKLSEPVLWEITKQLDAEGFSLKDELQPAQWQPIAQHNQKFPKAAIKTFEQAARDPRFVRSIRRRLYIARQEFENAHSDAAV